MITVLLCLGRTSPASHTGSPWGPACASVQGVCVCVCAWCLGVMDGGRLSEEHLPQNSISQRHQATGEAAGRRGTLSPHTPGNSSPTPGSPLTVKFMSISGRLVHPSDSVSPSPGSRASSAPVLKPGLPPGPAPPRITHSPGRQAGEDRTPGFPSTAPRKRYKELVSLTTSHRPGLVSSGKLGVFSGGSSSQSPR